MMLKFHELLIIFCSIILSYTYIYNNIIYFYIFIYISRIFFYDYYYYYNNNYHNDCILKFIIIYDNYHRNILLPTRCDREIKNKALGNNIWVKI